MTMPPGPGTFRDAGNDDKFQHIARSPLPWRPASLTECGLPTHCNDVITVEQFTEKYKRLGRERVSMVTCVTCWSTADRHSRLYHNPWTDDTAILLDILEREITFARRKDHATFPRELKAITMLIERHREEFDEFIADHAETVPIRSASKKTRDRK